MLKIYSIKGFFHILKQQNDIHAYVLQRAKHMHFTPHKLINFETTQIKCIKELHYQLKKFESHDIVTISTTTYQCNVTRKNKIIWKSKINKDIIARC